MTLAPTNTDEVILSVECLDRAEQPREKKIDGTHYVIRVKIIRCMFRISLPTQSFSYARSAAAMCYHNIGLGFEATGAKEVGTIVELLYIFEYD